MPLTKCAACGKTAYQLESVVAIEKTFHKACFKCSVCKATLNLKNFTGFEGAIYCKTHTPKVRHTAVTDSVSVKAALSAPKKQAEGLVTAHRGAKETAPQRADFAYHDANVDQSTENAPASSAIKYDAHEGDQSTENAPASSAITYDAHEGDQSTENAPDASAVTYDAHEGDQSTENAPDASAVAYDATEYDQSTEGYGETAYEEGGYDQQY